MVRHYYHFVNMYTMIVNVQFSQIPFSNSAQCIQFSGRTKYTFLFMGTDRHKIIVLSGIIKARDSRCFSRWNINYSTCISLVGEGLDPP